MNHASAPSQNTLFIISLFPDIVKPISMIRTGYSGNPETQKADRFSVNGGQLSVSVILVQNTFCGWKIISRGLRPESISYASRS
jgi:hypothetical protein